MVISGFIQKKQFLKVAIGEGRASPTWQCFQSEANSVRTLRFHSRSSKNFLSRQTPPFCYKPEIWSLQGLTTANEVSQNSGTICDLELHWVLYLRQAMFCLIDWTYDVSTKFYMPEKGALGTGMAIVFCYLQHSRLTEPDQSLVNYRCSARTSFPI